MTATMIVKCDGPNCNREIQSGIHAGTWLQLHDRDLFKPNFTLTPTQHFCSYYCLQNYIAPHIKEHPSFH